MRRTVLTLGLIAFVTACNPSAPQSEAPNAGASGLFPDLSRAAYRAEGRIVREGQSVPVVTIRDGANFRMEISADQGQTVMIRNGQTGETYSVITAGGRTMAMRMTDPVGDPSADWDATAVAEATRVGECSGAGLTGVEWSRTDEDGTVNTACVTQDGILLRAAANGQPVWETTSVQPGPQSPDLFMLPPGVQVVDLNNLQGMADAIRGGQ